MQGTDSSSLSCDPKSSSHIKNLSPRGYELGLIGFWPQLSDFNTGFAFSVFCYLWISLSFFKFGFLKTFGSYLTQHFHEFGAGKMFISAEFITFPEMISIMSEKHYALLK